MYDLSHQKVCMSSCVLDMSCPRPVHSGEHHGDGTCPSFLQIFGRGTR